MTEGSPAAVGEARLIGLPEEIKPRIAEHRTIRGSRERKPATPDSAEKKGGEVAARGNENKSMPRCMLPGITFRRPSIAGLRISSADGTRRTTAAFGESHGKLNEL